MSSPVAESPMSSVLALHYTAADAKVSATAPTAPTVVTFGGAGDDILVAYKATVAYAVMFVLLWALSKTQAGYALIYYGLCLMIFFLLVTQYQWIAQALSPLDTSGSANPGGPINGTKDTQSMGG